MSTEASKPRVYIRVELPSSDPVDMMTRAVDGLLEDAERALGEGYDGFELVGVVSTPEWSYLRHTQVPGASWPELSILEFATQVPGISYGCTPDMHALADAQRPLLEELMRRPMGE